MKNKWTFENKDLKSKIRRINWNEFWTSYSEFCAGHISPCSFTWGWDFHCQTKPPFSYFALVIMWLWTITCASWHGLLSPLYLTRILKSCHKRNDKSNFSEKYEQVLPCKINCAAWFVKNGKTPCYYCYFSRTFCT